MTIKEILALPIEERRQKYTAVDIDKVTIDGDTYTDFKAFSFLWEFSYVVPFERSSGGVVDNINSYAGFVTPHLKIDFSLLSIDSYRNLMKALYSKREFLVRCYDIVYDRIVEEKMYFATEEMPKLWTITKALNGEKWVELLGVQDYTVEMIGTNASIETINILYYDNNKTLISGATQVVNKGTEVIINYDYKPQAPYKFTGVWKDSSGKTYRNGEVVTLTGELKLYADTTNENEYTLSFNYGVGISPLNVKNSQPVISINIRGAVFDVNGNLQTKGQSIESAISNANITTTNGKFIFYENGTGLEKVTYTLGAEQKEVLGELVYQFKGWYWTNEANNSTQLNKDSTFDYNTNRTIFQIYEPIKHRLVFQTNTTQIELEEQWLGFKENIQLPRLALSGKTFVNWYLDQEFKKQAPSVMPPESITLYAKWE